MVSVKEEKEEGAICRQTATALFGSPLILNGKEAESIFDYWQSMGLLMKNSMSHGKGRYMDHRKSINLVFTDC